MKFDQKMSYKQIADETGLSVSNVGYKLHVIIRDLSTELQEEGIIG
jgi:DNA-directed RNA polymerase specialized sigma24 family protein